MTRAALTGIFAIVFALTASAVPTKAQDLGQYPDNSLENRYRGIVAANVDSSNGRDELVVDFGAVGVWVRTGVINDLGDWQQISGVDPDNITAGDIDGDGADEVFADFGSLGLWLWNDWVWSQISANNPD